MINKCPKQQQKAKMAKIPDFRAKTNLFLDWKLLSFLLNLLETFSLIIEAEPINYLSGSPNDFTKKLIPNFHEFSKYF